MNLKPEHTYAAAPPKLSGRPHGSGMSSAMDLESYNPEALFKLVGDTLGVKNDAQLARALDITPPQISKIRHRKLGVGALLLLRMHDITGLPVNDLRAAAGLPLGELRVTMGLPQAGHGQAQ